MSIIVSTPAKINQCPSNRSTAKMLYSFGKGARFFKEKQNICPQFYEIQSCSSAKPATSLGYGNKYDFTREYMPKTPAPGTYNCSDWFDISVAKGKGCRFGSGREEMAVTGLFKKNENPGPGAYQMPTTKSKIEATMKGKSKVNDRQHEMNPGPGTYQNNVGFNKCGDQICSKYKNKPSYRFSQEKKLKFQVFGLPGPGTYNSRMTELSPYGKYPLSRLPTTKSTIFGRSQKFVEKSRSKTPGPGAYRMPSQFGHYESRVALESMTVRQEVG